MSRPTQPTLPFFPHQSRPLYLLVRALSSHLSRLPLPRGFSRQRERLQRASLTTLVTAAEAGLQFDQRNVAAGRQSLCKAEVGLTRISEHVGALATAQAISRLQVGIVEAVIRRVREAMRDEQAIWPAGAAGSPPAELTRSARLRLN